jgi:hypothetical protein
MTGFAAVFFGSAGFTFFAGRDLPSLPVVFFNWGISPVASISDLTPIAESELKELAEDIKKYGLHNPIIAWRNSDKELMLVDGRNRLDALATLGLLGVDKDGHLEFRTRPIDYGPFICAHREADPYAVALSHNIHRRHLTLEQKRDLIAELLKLQPEKSNRQIADVVKADHKTVGSGKSSAAGWTCR